MTQKLERASDHSPRPGGAQPCEPLVGPHIVPAQKYTEIQDGADRMQTDHAGIGFITQPGPDGDKDEALRGLRLDRSSAASTRTSRRLGDKREAKGGGRAVCMCMFAETSLVVPEQTA